MNVEHIALLLDDMRLSLDELAASCTVTREWIIAHVEAGVLLDEPGPDPEGWRFSSRELLRTRKMFDLERAFDANPELAGLVVDMIEELQRLRKRLRRAGLELD